MKSIEAAARIGYRWHVRCSLVAVCVLLAACASARPEAPLDTPSEAARHRAALATVVVANETPEPLTIAFRTATPPVQEVVIGQAPAGARARMAPIPAGEPIVMIARRQDGSELAIEARSFPLDIEWTWDIPRDAAFTKPARAN